MLDRQSSIENPPRVALLTGGDDRPYVFGLATTLASKRAILDVIGSDDLDFPELCSQPGINFLNLRGNLRSDVGFARKVLRVLRYYGRLVCYAATAKPRIFHILWNNRFEIFDRTLLMLYYKLLGKTIVFTAHNVNAGSRDGNDTTLNRITLRVQYHLADHLFVHTEKMKRELLEEFGVKPARVTMIPFGINNAVPNTGLTSGEARQRLGIHDGEKAILFFGNITPYKGLEYLVAAFQKLKARSADYRLIIAGSPNKSESYWRTIIEMVREDAKSGSVLLRAEHIPDDETEIFFKAADVFALPYRYIYESGVLFTGYNFGLPVLAADVGSLKDEIVEGKTGFIFRPQDPDDLAKAIERFFASDLYANLSSQRQEIRDYAAKRHSWDVVSDLTLSVYAGLTQLPARRELRSGEAPGATFDVNPPL